MCFNESNDKNIYKDEEVEYMINMLRFNSKDFTKSNMLQPIYNKTMATLKHLLSDEEICLTQLSLRL
jgi:hypothetical protein